LVRRWLSADRTRKYKEMKLFQIEEPDGSPAAAADGAGMAVGIGLSVQNGASVAVSVGGNAELLPAREGAAKIQVKPDPHEDQLVMTLRALREQAEKALSQPVTHAVIALDGMKLSHTLLVRAAALADLALLDVRDGTALDAAIEAEDIAAVLSR